MSVRYKSAESPKRETLRRQDVHNKFRNLEGYKIVFDRASKQSTLSITFLTNFSMRKLNSGRDYADGAFLQYQVNMNASGEVTNISAINFKLIGFGSSSIIGQMLEVTHISSDVESSKIYDLQNVRIDLQGLKTGDLLQDSPERVVLNLPLIKAYSSLVQQRKDLLMNADVPYKSKGNFTEDIIGYSLDYITEGIIPPSITKLNGSTIIEVPLKEDTKASKELKNALYTPLE